MGVRREIPALELPINCSGFSEASVPYSVPSALFSVEHPAASRAADAIKYMSCLFKIGRAHV